MTLFIVSIAIALGVSFLCSIMEAALLSITPSKIAVIAERFPATGRICREFRKDIEKPIAVILILNTAAPYVRRLHRRRGIRRTVRQPLYLDFLSCIYRYDGSVYGDSAEDAGSAFQLAGDGIYCPDTQVSGLADESADRIGAPDQPSVRSA